MTTANVIEQPNKTLCDLEQDSKFMAFYMEYIEALKNSLTKNRVIGREDFIFYSCGQAHDRRNPDWKPFAILWKLSEKHDYDFYIVKDMLEDHLGRKLTCECEVLTDPKELKRRRLENVGVDFDSGIKEMEIL